MPLPSEKTMPKDAEKERNENSNHVTESSGYCEYLGGEFPVKFSRLGIIYFKCPMYSKNKNNQEDIACLELQTTNCHVRDSLEKRIEKL